MLHQVIVERFMRDDLAAVARLARTCRLCADELRPFLTQERARRLIARLALNARRFWRVGPCGRVHVSRALVAAKTGRVLLRERVVYAFGEERVETRLTTITPARGRVVHVVGGRVVASHRYDDSLVALARFLQAHTLAGGAWGPWDVFQGGVVPPASELWARARDDAFEFLLREAN